MSASLKEKLKRSRHSFRSPLKVVKRLKIEDDTEPQPSQQGEETPSVNDDRDATDTDVNRNDMKLQRDSDHTAELTEKHPSQQCEALRKAVKERTETLRRLKMVKMYRKKVNIYICILGCETTTKKSNFTIYVISYLDDGIYHDTVSLYSINSKICDYFSHFI